MTPTGTLRIVTGAAIILSALAAMTGLFWSPSDGALLTPELYGSGLYRRDTPFVAGGSKGSDIFTLFIVLPLATWCALTGVTTRRHFMIITVADAWWLYLSISLAFGSVAFNEALPVYIAMLPVSLIGLATALPRLRIPNAPCLLALFLVFCGVTTAGAWTFLLWIEMAAGQFPPTTYYTVRTTYALDLGLIAPGCVAAGLAVWKRWAFWPYLSVPLLGVCATLLPMMALQTVMQISAGVTFGPEAIAPFLGFGLISPMAAWFLWRMARAPASQ